MWLLVFSQQQWLLWWCVWYWWVQVLLCVRVLWMWVESSLWLFGCIDCMRFFSFRLIRFFLGGMLKVVVKLLFMLNWLEGIFQIQVLMMVLVFMVSCICWMFLCRVVLVWWCMVMLWNSIEIWCIFIGLMCVVEILMCWFMVWNFCLKCSGWLVSRIWLQIFSQICVLFGLILCRCLLMMFLMLVCW